MPETVPYGLELWSLQDAQRRMLIDVDASAALIGLATLCFRLLSYIYWCSYVLTSSSLLSSYLPCYSIVANPHSETPLCSLPYLQSSLQQFF